MSETDRLAGLFVGSSQNTVLSWILVVVLVSNVLGGVISSHYEAVLISAVAITIIIAPAIVFRDATMMPPWYFVGLICLPLLWRTFAPQPLVLASSLALATLGLLIAIELHRFTTLRLVPWFAIILTVLFTLAMAALLNIFRWSSDVLFGTTFLLDERTQDTINNAVMIELIYVTIASLIAGSLFYLYYQRAPEQDDSPMAVLSTFEARAAEEEAILSERIGISKRRQTQLVRAMQIVLVAVFVYGVWSQQLNVLTNAVLALVVTFLPAILERDYGIPLEPGLTVWVTSAVFLHALGSASLYSAIAPWDHLTHILSATVVTAVGYAMLRAIHLHVESIHLPRWALFTFMLVFILSMGVIWEVLEFFVDQGALFLGIDPVLAQHGINDTIVDMIFNVVGAVIVATWGTVYLTGVSDNLVNYLERRS